MKQRSLNKFLIGLFAAGWLLISACIPPRLIPTTTPTPNACKKIAFVSHQIEGDRIYTICPDGSRLTQLTDDPKGSFYPAWSPDGSRLAFASTRSGSWQIYIMDEDGSHVVQLTTDYDNDSPVWLPNGKNISFRSNDGKGLWWWRMINLDTRQVSNLTQASYDFFFQTPAWSPDGRQMAYMSLVEQQPRNDGASQIHVKNADGSEDYALTQDTWANISPIWSPDGQQIAFLSERDGLYNQFTLYVVDKNGANLRKLSGAIYSENTTFSWSPDQTQITISDSMLGKTISIIDLSTGNTHPLLELTQGQSGSYSHPAWQP